MKTIKFLILLIAAGIAVLFGYANVRQRSVTERLKPVNLISFDLRGDLQKGEWIMLEKKISAFPGVTACSLNQRREYSGNNFLP